MAKATGSEAGKQVLLQYGFDYTAVFAIGWSDLHHVICVLHDRSDAVQKKRASSSAATS